MKKQEASHQAKIKKTRVTLSLSKNGISMSKNLTPSDIEMIQNKLERAKEKLLKNQAYSNTSKRIADQMSNLGISSQTLPQIGRSAT